MEDILSAAVSDSIRRAERGVFRPEIPVFDLCMIVRVKPWVIEPPHLAFPRKEIQKAPLIKTKPDSQPEHHQPNLEGYYPTHLKDLNPTQKSY